jgi:hypothetical protein
MLKNIEGRIFENAPPWLKDNTIFLTKAGSHAYGLATETSDLDIRGIAIEPIEYVIGVTQSFEQFQLHSDDLDVCIFGLRKFCQLALQCNPNVLELLYVLPESILLSTPLYNMLRDNRYLFLSQKARHTFRGYAMSQLKKILRKSEYGTTGKRAETIEKFGYDTKHAMHLVRLMRMGEEVLRDGAVNVWRSDRNDLLAIRNGAMTLIDLELWTAEKDKELETVESTLQWGPDMQKTDALLLKLLLDFWHLRGRDTEWV